MNKADLASYSDKFNVMILGDEGVGKTSILERYSKGIFTSSNKPSSNSKPKASSKRIELLTKEFTLNKETYLFKLWDTIIDEKTGALSKSYCSKADCIVVVCSIVNKASLTNAIDWINSASEAIDISTIKMILLANKCDMEDDREIGLDEVRQGAEDLNVKFFETSAMSGYGIDEAFEYLFTQVIKNVYKDSNTGNGNDNEGSGKGDSMRDKDGSQASSTNGGCYLI